MLLMARNVGPVTAREIMRYLKEPEVGRMVDTLSMWDQYKP